jgi:hypothetical protein
MSTPATEEPSLLTILVRSVVAAGVLSAGTAVRRAASTAGAYFVVAILFAVSLCFLTFGGYLALSLAIGSIHASLIIGCVYLFLGLIAALVLQARRR